MFARRTHQSAETRLTSTKNPLLREIRKAVERGSLTSDGLCVAEGFHLLREAQRGPCSIDAVVASEAAAAEVRPMGLDFFSVPDDVFASIASTETTQGVIALVRPHEFTPDDVFGKQPLVLVLDGIQDPGNAGTLIRAAEAFGATGVLLTGGSVNPWNPKAVRASAGSVFRVPLVRNATPELLEGRTVKVWAGRSGNTSSAVADFRPPSVIVIGSEARGVSLEWASIAEGLTIKTCGVESLNAGVAGSILLYEASSQRQRVG